MGTYHSNDAVVTLKGDIDRAAVPWLPEHVSVALHELAGASKEGLLALAVGTAPQVMHTLFEESVIAIAGPNGKHNPARTAVRHGSEAGRAADAWRCSVHECAAPTARRNWQYRRMTSSPAATS